MWGMFTGSGAHSGYAGGFANGEQHNRHHTHHVSNFSLFLLGMCSDSTCKHYFMPSSLSSAKFYFNSMLQLIEFMAHSGLQETPKVVNVHGTKLIKSGMSFRTFMEMKTRQRLIAKYQVTRQQESQRRPSR